MIRILISRRESGLSHGIVKVDDCVPAECTSACRRSTRAASACEMRGQRVVLDLSNLSLSVISNDSPGWSIIALTRNRKTRLQCLGYLHQWAADGCQALNLFQCHYVSTTLTTIIIRMSSASEYEEYCSNLSAIIP